MVFCIGFVLLSFVVCTGCSAQPLRLVFIAGIQTGMENSTVSKIEQFVWNVANTTFISTSDTEILLLPSIECCSYWDWFCYYCNFHNNISALQNNRFILDYYYYYYFNDLMFYAHHNLWYHRLNYTREIIFMITDGYQYYTKEAAQSILNDGVTIIAVIRTQNQTEINYMENATGDPSLVFPIVSFNDLSSIVDDSVNILLTGGLNLTGVPVYEVSKINVQYDLRWDNGIPGLNFFCNFTLIPDSLEFLYLVNWYVNGLSIGHTRIFYANETAKNVLTEKELTDNGFHHGINLKCSVSAKFSIEGKSGRVYTSDNFFAGIEILTSPIYIEENKEAVLKFRPTVPFACENGQNNCFLSVHVESPESMSCVENAVVQSSGRCREKIPGYSELNKTFYSQESNWKSEYNMSIIHTQSTSYDRDSYYTIALVTSSVLHKFWSEKQLSNIPVHIYTDNESWRGAYCYSHIDPHDRTFDGRHFEQQRQGHYIMYRHKKLDQEVQYETEACSYNGRSPFCICGLAIRAGRDVFLMYLCQKSRIIDFVSCEDNTLTVESDRFTGYKVLFPSGTQVNIRMACWGAGCFLNVDIYPTASDVKATEGLCGTLDGDCNNDFVKRDGSYSSTVTNDACPPPYSYIFPDDFSESWRPDTDRDLLPPLSDDVYDNLNPWSQNLLLCSCVFEEVNGTGKPNEEIDTISCSYKSYRDCSSNRYNPFSCDVPLHRSVRKRRELRERSKRSLNPLPESSHQILKRSTSLTEAEARFHCNNTLNSSAIYRLCKESVTEIGESAMEDCVLDVKMTGDINMSHVALQIVKDLCVTIVGKNTTLNDSSPEIVYAVKTQSCPNDCNQQGTCNNGVCDCDKGYSGDDCSVLLSDPPTVSELSQGEHCDVTDEECSLLKLRGFNFYSLHPRCRIEYETIEENGDVSNRSIIYKHGEQKSQFEAMCNIQSIQMFLKNGSTPGFVTSYKVSISNDNITFSTNFTVVLYDSGCQIRDTTKGRFVLKENYCYIGNTCYYHMNSHPSSTNMTCCSTIDSFQWHPSRDCGKRDKLKRDDESNLVTILSAVSVTLMLIITGILLLYCKKSIGHRKAQEVQPTVCQDKLPSRPTMSQKSTFTRPNVIQP